MHKLSYAQLPLVRREEITEEEWNEQCAKFRLAAEPESCLCGRLNCDCWVSILRQPAQFRSSPLYK